MGWRERRRRRQPGRGKWLPGYWLRHPAFSLVACGLAGVVTMLAAFGTAYETSRLNAHGLQASATVLEVHGGRGSYVVARFTTADGRTVVTDVHDYYWSPTPKEGDTATILYDPEDPEEVVRDIRIKGDYLGAWLWGGVTLLSAGLAVFLIRTWNVWLAAAEAWRAR